MAYQPPPMPPYPQPVYAPMVIGPKPSSGVLIGAGVLNIITAVIGFIVGSLLVVGGGMMMPFDPTGTMAGIVALCGGLTLLGGIFALLGGIFSLKRTNFGMSVLASLLGMIFTAPTIIGFILGMIALILVIVGKDDFLDRAPTAYAPMPVAVMPPYPVYQPAPPQPGGQWKFCSNCGSQVEMTASACPKCGARA